MLTHTHASHSPQPTADASAKAAISCRTAAGSSITWRQHSVVQLLKLVETASQQIILRHHPST
jgi:hypothetical protein